MEENLQGKTENGSKLEKKDVLILAIESSCDETAAAVVKNGRTVLSNIISSQIDLHTLYGGVVPEIASRKHIEKINQVVQAALDEANVDRVGTYFNKYIGKTQLIIITHKKKTMEYANTLYGITMQESGVSKLVSVKLVD